MTGCTRGRRSGVLGPTAQTPRSVPGPWPPGSRADTGAPRHPVGAVPGTLGGRAASPARTFPMPVETPMDVPRGGPVTSLLQYNRTHLDTQPPRMKLHFPSLSRDSESPRRGPALGLYGDSQEVPGAQAHRASPPACLLTVDGCSDQALGPPGADTNPILGVTASLVGT